jgi:iron(III) transport system ATP-binding protein
LYVTHDQAEAFALGDEILVMEAGQIVQKGSPEELYQRPSTPFVTRFLGMENIFPFKRSQDNPADRADPFGKLQLSSESPLPDSGQLLIRPEAARLQPQLAEQREPVTRSVDGAFISRPLFLAHDCCGG